MIHRHARDHAGQRPLDDIGGVKTAAEPDFEEQNVRRMAREQEKRRRRLDFKNRDRRAAILGFAFDKRIGKLRILDEFAAAPLVRGESAR